MFEDVFSKEENSFLRFNTSFLKVLSSHEWNWFNTEEEVGGTTHWFRHSFNSHSDARFFDSHTSAELIASVECDGVFLVTHDSSYYYLLRLAFLSRVRGMIVSFLINSSQ